VPRTHRRRAPGERAGLALEAVLAAARALSARQGVAGVTIRGVARRLGVAPNTLYSHFADKSALVEALLDSLLAAVELPAPPGKNWSEDLFRLMSESRRLLLAHAELIPLFLARPTPGPNALRLGEATLALLARAGLRGQEAVDALQVLLVYAIGFAAHEAPRRAGAAPARRRARAEAATRDLPHLRALASELARHPTQDTFERGLRWLIQGIAGAAHP
jgi:TetR/AcrR family transcriptional regulator, tetracycline repressor protein